MTSVHRPATDPARQVRTRARRGEGDQTRTAILDAAQVLLEERGSEEAVSIRAVADAVGLTPPAIYRHFPDKAHLIFEVCGRQFDRLDEEVVRPALAEHDDPLDALLAIARGYVRFGVENPEPYRVMFMSHADHSPELYGAEQVLVTGALGATIALVEAAIGTGQVRGDFGGAMGVTWALWSALHGIVATSVAKPNLPGPSLDERVETTLAIFVRGISA